MTDFAEVRWRSHDGLSLYARDYAPQGAARGAPVICLHGLTRNSRDFEVLAPWIAARGRRVLALDVRGRGRSDYDPQPQNYQPGVYGLDVIGLAASLGLDKALFVGTSMGGLITLAVAMTRPDLVAGVALNDVGPELGAEGVKRILGYAGRTPAMTSWADAAAHVRDLNQAVFPDYGPADWDRFARRAFRETSTGPVPDYDPAIALPLAAAPDDPPATPPDLWDAFAAMTEGRPSLLIRGATSDILSAEIAARMRRQSPSMAFVEVPRTGHAPMLDEPAALAALDALLARA